MISYDGCVSLTSLSMIISRSNHVMQIALFHSFFMTDIPLCIDIYHIFFIQSSLDRHLGCFHVLAIVNTAAVTIEVHVSFWIRVFSHKCTRVGLLDHMVTLFLVFTELPYRSPECLHQFTFPPTFWRVSFSPHPERHLIFFKAL